MNFNLSERIWILQITVLVRYAHSRVEALIVTRGKEGFRVIPVLVLSVQMGGNIFMKPKIPKIFNILKSGHED